ncbi:MAG: sirohydrochlorin cobaltochelatase [Pseudomonadota bacterium]
MNDRRENLKIFLPGTRFPAGHAQPRPDKAGLLLVAFGTSVAAARGGFHNIHALAGAEFPGLEIRWAFTSPTIRKIMAGRGEPADSTVTALARMMEEGFTHVALGSLHTIRGKEYEDLVETARAFLAIPKGFCKAVVGSPLLSSRRDIELVAAALIENLPRTRKSDEAVLFMGHGTPHPADAHYLALMQQARELDDLVFIGTVDGPPGIGDLAAKLRAGGVRKAYLMPFMSAAGEHARRDLAGDGPDSWRSVLQGLGIEVAVVMKGTAEYDNLAALWIDHIRDAVTELFAAN